MDGGDADGVMEVDEEEEDPPPLEGGVEGEVVDALDADDPLGDADERDIDLGSALRNFASPLRCISVHSRLPLEQCFGAIWQARYLRRSNGRRRYPRLGYCFWHTQDRCDECGRGSET